MKTADPLVVIVARQDVESCNVAPTMIVLSRLLESVDTARAFEKRVDIAFHGYDGVRSELHEIPEVRSFVYALDELFPYWLWFLTREGTGLSALALCYLPPFLTEQAQREVWPVRLMELLDRRWFPALGALCQQVGLTEADFFSRCMDSVHYFREGARLPMDPLQ